jgi:hypothetical protein
MIVEDGFKQMRDAAGQALRNVRSASGMTNDPEVIRYQRLKPQDFETLAAKFGRDTVTGYIQDMESRKYREGG